MTELELLLLKNSHLRSLLRLMTEALVEIFSCVPDEEGEVAEIKKLTRSISDRLDQLDRLEADNHVEPS